MIASQAAQLRGTLAEAERVVRYLWAAQLTADRRVLHVGCGTGEGSELLADAGAAEVVGVDTPAAMIEVAGRRERANLRFERVDLASLAFADDSFDVAVCFDVLQGRDDPGGLLTETARVLRPDGVLCVSWRSPLEPEEALRRHWRHVRLLPQERLIGSALPAGSEAAQQVRRLAGSPDASAGFVAIACAADPPEPAPVVGLGGALGLAGSTDEEPRVLLSELATLAAERERLGARLMEAEAFAERVVQLEADLEDSERRRVELQTQRDGAREALDDVTASFSWRVTRPLRALKRLLGSP